MIDQTLKVFLAVAALVLSTFIIASRTIKGAVLKLIMTMRTLALGQNNQRNRVSYVAVDTRGRNWNQICISYPDYWTLHRRPREQRGLHIRSKQGACTEQG
ncbi:mRNA 3'-end-processing protein YTH1 [Fusarium oxysporum f. sp. albedinis]|nr:mRNA 3'-end-processing protein YTH1 [Fusarium oxysporum f. sp. albedinis]